MRKKKKIIQLLSVSIALVLSVLQPLQVCPAFADEPFTDKAVSELLGEELQEDTTFSCQLPEEEFCEQASHENEQWGSMLPDDLISDIYSESDEYWEEADADEESDPADSADHDQTSDDEENVIEAEADESFVESADIETSEEIFADEVDEEENENGTDDPEDLLYSLDDPGNVIEEDFEEELTGNFGDTDIALIGTGETSGYCGANGGNNVSWRFDASTGTLFLSGKGEMGTYNDKEFWGQTNFVPWYDYRDQIKRAVVGDGITFIGWWAFAHTHITEITFPSSVRTLGQGALAYCYDLKTVNLNDGLTDIEGSVFKEDTLDELILPASVERIASTALTHATIGSIRIRGSGGKLDIIDGIILSADHKTLFRFPRERTGSYDIPSTVETIKEYAFFYSKLSHVTIPDSVKTIEGRAFADAANLEEIIIPDSVTNMQYGAFSGCSRAKEIVIGNGLELIDTDAFGENKAAVSIKIGNKVKKIHYAFSYCSSIEEITIPDSVTGIEYGAFNSCSKLKTVHLGKRVKEIGYASFANCVQLEEITLPEGLATIGEGAFHNTAIKKVIIPSSVTEIGINAFPADAEVICEGGIIHKNEDGSYVSQEVEIDANLTVAYDQNSARSMLAMVNAMRTGKDAWYWDSSNAEKITPTLTALTYDYTLEKLAMQRAAEIAVTFSHTRPDGTDCYTIADNLAYSAIGENIACGQTTAKAAFRAWSEENEQFRGQGHRRNMLSGNFNCIGIGHARYQGVDYWVQEFLYIDKPDTTKTNAINAERDVSITFRNTEERTWEITPAEKKIMLDLNESTTVPKAMVGSGYSGKTLSLQPQWTSSDPSIVRVEGQTLTAMKQGKAKLTATVLGKKLKVQVLVGYLKKAVITEISNKAKGIKLSWSRENGSQSFKVYRKTGKTWKLLKKTSKISYIDTTVKKKDGQIFIYRVESLGKNRQPSMSDSVRIRRNSSQK